MRTAPTGDTANPWIDHVLFFVVAVTWSSSFLFIKIAVVEIGPWTITAGRIVIAAVILAAYLRLAGHALPRDPRAWAKCAFIGLVGNVLPFYLIGYGEQSVDSALAAILMGIMPVATIVLAHLLIPEEPFSARRALGVATGFGGVLVLVGDDALRGFGGAALAQLAIVGGAVCYAISTVFVRRTVTMAGPVMAAGSQIAGATMVVPLAFWFESPLAYRPSTSALAAVVVLGVFSTAVAMLIYFRLVKQLGAGKMAQVNYLIPVLGAAWGVAFLGERFAPSTLLALAMVLAGIAIVSGRRRARPAGEPG